MRLNPCPLSAANRHLDAKYLKHTVIYKRRTLLQRTLLNISHVMIVVGPTVVKVLFSLLTACLFVSSTIQTSCLSSLPHTSTFSAFEVFTEKRYINSLLLLLLLLARDVIYTSRAYATMSVSVCLSVCL